MTKISLIQCNSVLGSIEANKQKILSELKKSRENGSDILIFPEMFFSGYQPLDMVKKKAFLEDIFSNLEKLAAEITKYKKCIVLGAPILSDEKIYNACLILKDGMVKIGSKKVHLPNYDVFDEERYFSNSDIISVVILDGITIGFPICEDSWFPDVISNMKELGAELIVVTNGSPYETGKLDERQRLIEKRCYETEIPIIYLNLVGGQDDVVFDGGSFVCDKKGKIVEQFPQFKEFTKQVAFEKSSRTLSPLPERSEINFLPQINQEHTKFDPYFHHLQLLFHNYHRFGFVCYLLH